MTTCLMKFADGERRVANNKLLINWLC